jgi:hypothetical protein
MEAEAPSEMALIREAYFCSNSGKRELFLPDQRLGLAYPVLLDIHHWGYACTQFEHSCEMKAAHVCYSGEFIQHD